MSISRSRWRAALAVAGVIGLLIPVVARTTRDARRRADLRYFAAELPKRHVAAYRYVTPAAFAGAVADVDAAIPRLTDAQWHLRLLRLAALLQDGHTGADYPHYQGRLPLEVLWTEAGPVVVGADSARAGLLGRRIVGVDGRPITAVADTLALYLPHENVWGFRRAAAAALVVPGVLRDMQVAEATASLTLDLESSAAAVSDPTPRGTTAAPPRVTVPVVAVRDAWSAPFTPAPPGHGEPLYRQRRDAPYWLAYLPGDRLAFVKYNECRDSADFAQIADSVARLVDAGRVTRVVVDLRDNQGGNSQVTRPLVEALKARPAVNRPGGLYVAIGRTTFSSGLMAADDFRKETRAVLVGEPVGERPNNYGEVQMFRLPWSRIYVWHSTKAFRFAEHDADAYTPDTLVPPTPAAIIAGRDPVLDWVLARGAGRDERVPEVTPAGRPNAARPAPVPRSDPPGAHAIVVPHARGVAGTYPCAPPNEALQLSGTQGCSCAALGSISPRHQCALTTRS